MHTENPSVLMSGLNYKNNNLNYDSGTSIYKSNEIKKDSGVKFLNSKSFRIFKTILSKTTINFVL